MRAFGPRAKEFDQSDLRLPSEDSRDKFQFIWSKLHPLNDFFLGPQKTRASTSLPLDIQHFHWKTPFVIRRNTAYARELRIGC